MSQRELVFHRHPRHSHTRITVHNSQKNVHVSATTPQTPCLEHKQSRSDSNDPTQRSSDITGNGSNGGSEEKNKSMSKASIKNMLIKRSKSITQLAASAISKQVTKTQNTLQRFGLLQLVHFISLIVFMLIGAVICQALDGDAGLELIIAYEQRCREQIRNATALLDLLCEGKMYAECRGVVQTMMAEVDSCHRSKQWSSKPSEPMAEFKNALLYAISVCSTVGYGYVHPITTDTKAFTIVYACIGIPYFLAVVTDVGKFLRLCMLATWNYCQPMQKKSHQRRFDNATTIDLFTIPSKQSRWLLFIVAALFTLIYIILLAAFFHYMHHESWTYFDSFYFVFQSICLVGFGDLYPDSKTNLESGLFMFMAICFISMCFFTLQQSISETVEFTATTIHNHIGGASKRITTLRRKASSLFRRSPLSKLPSPEPRKVLYVESFSPTQCSITSLEVYGLAVDAKSAQLRQENTKPVLQPLNVNKSAQNE